MKQLEAAKLGVCYVFFVNNNWQANDYLFGTYFKSFLLKSDTVQSQISGTKYRNKTIHRIWNLKAKYDREIIIQKYQIKKTHFSHGITIRNKIIQRIWHMKQNRVFFILDLLY